MNASPVPRGAVKALLPLATITPFLRAARERGCPVVDGVEMLVQLAMQIFGRWTGIRPDEAVFQAAVSTALGEARPSAE